MTVVDASVLVDAIVGLGAHGSAARRELRTAERLAAPAILPAEATSALRGLVLRGQLSTIRAATALQQVRTVRSVLYPFAPFIDRTWELRDNMTTYDAWYVALAESLQTDLVTADVNLAGAVGARCRVRLPG